jgi:hypothetical protein
VHELQESDRKLITAVKSSCILQTLAGIDSRLCVSFSRSRSRLLLLLGFVFTDLLLTPSAGCTINALFQPCTEAHTTVASFYPTKGVPFRSIACASSVSRDQLTRKRLHHPAVGSGLRAVGFELRAVDATTIHATGRVVDRGLGANTTVHARAAAAASSRGDLPVAAAAAAASSPSRSTSINTANDCTLPALHTPFDKSRVQSHVPHSHKSRRHCSSNPFTHQHAHDWRDTPQHWRSGCAAGCGDK